MSFEDKAAQEKEQKRQKELDLVMNVFRRGQWGHYVSLPLEKGKYLNDRIVIIHTKSLNNCMVIIKMSKAHVYRKMSIEFFFLI